MPLSLRPLLIITVKLWTVKMLIDSWFNLPTTRISGGAKCFDGGRIQSKNKYNKTEITRSKLDRGKHMPHIQCQVISCNNKNI